LGCGAHLTSLRRVRSGEFRIEDSRDLGEVERIGAAGALETVLVPMEKLLPNFPALVLEDGDKERVRHGNSVPAPCAEDAPAPGTVTRLLDQEGKLLALARKAAKEGELAPFLVLIG